MDSCVFLFSEQLEKRDMLHNMCQILVMHCLSENAEKCIFVLFVTKIPIQTNRFIAQNDNSRQFVVIRHYNIIQVCRFGSHLKLTPE